jgi:hypothetical protein
LLKEPYEKQLAKKKPHVNGTIISNFFVATNFYEKYDMHQKQFLEYLTFFNY